MVGISFLILYLLENPLKKQRFITSVQKIDCLLAKQNELLSPMSNERSAFKT